MRLFLPIILSLTALNSALVTLSPPFTISSATSALQQTLALYPYAVDNKNLTNFPLIFNTTGSFNYGAIGNFTTAASLATLIASGLGGVITQHSFTTFLVLDMSLVEGKESASTVQYAIATHWGLGVYVGQTYVAYGYVVDEWAIVNGGWRIWKRDIVNQMLVGNASIFN